MKKILLLFLLFPVFVFGQLTPQFLSLKPVYTNYEAFTFTGADQQWTVPAGVTQIFVDVIGAQGGSKGSALGGLGGRIVANMNVTPGETLLIMVGGQPSARTAVYGNGGNAGNNTTVSANISVAGGGMSAIFRTSFAINNAIIVAGGGGGAATSRNGGAAGGANGAVSAADSTRGGKGGTQTAGGAAGTILDTNPTMPTAGTLGNGGAGGFPNLSTHSSGGGGGAGYYGGGGGAAGGNYFGAGGGGSSWANTSAATNIRNAGAHNRGHGKVVVYW